MKRLKLRKAIASLLISLSIVTVIAPISAHADWKQSSNGKWWYQSGSSYYSNSWKQVDGLWYYFQQDGYILQNSWLNYQGHYFYLTSNGTMATNLWVQSGGNWYYMGSNGAMVTNQWVGSYYLGSDGAWTTISDYFKNAHAPGIKPGTNGASSQSMSEQNK